MNRCFVTEGIKIVGDPHLGKVFMNGVPLARRGERERLQRQAFIEAMDPQEARLHIVLGDLFDRPKVSFETIFFAAEAYRASDPQVEFFVLAGNHDLSRDSTQVSALQLFQMMVPNVHVLTEPTRIADDLLAIPWSPWKTAAEVVGEINEGAATALGHRDIDGNGPNLIPTKPLAQLGIKRGLQRAHPSATPLRTRRDRDPSMSARCRPTATARVTSCTSRSIWISSNPTLTSTATNVFASVSRRASSSISMWTA